MIELKRYTCDELADIFNGSNKRQDLKKRLDRYNVKYEIEGRGNNATFNILEIEDVFKVFCLVELGADSRCDFDRMKYFYYYFFCDDEFILLTDEQKEEYMDEKEQHVSRQTIRKWKEYLGRNYWFDLKGEECRYYFTRKETKEKDRKAIHKDATKEEYSEAWKYYWRRRDEGEISWIIMNEIREKYGGVPRKHYIPQANAFYLDKINEFIEIIIESVESDIKPNT